MPHNSEEENVGWDARAWDNLISACALANQLGMSYGDVQAFASIVEMDLDNPGLANAVNDQLIRDGYYQMNIPHEIIEWVHERRAAYPNDPRPLLEFDGSPLEGLGESTVPIIHNDAPAQAQATGARPPLGTLFYDPDSDPENQTQDDDTQNAAPATAAPIQPAQYQNDDHDKENVAPRGR